MTAIPFALKPRATAPAPAAKDEVWFNIDPASLPEDLAKLYYAYRQANDIATQARKLFESETNEAFDCGKGNHLRFGYKFGKLSATIEPIASRTAPKGARAMSDLAKLR